MYLYDQRSYKTKHDGNQPRKKQMFRPLQSGLKMRVYAQVIEKGIEKEEL